MKAAWRVCVQASYSSAWHMLTVEGVYAAPTRRPKRIDFCPASNSLTLARAVQVVDLVKEYNTLGRGCVAIMLDTKGPEVRSGDLAAPIDLVPGAALEVRV